MLKSYVEPIRTAFQQKSQHDTRELLEEEPNKDTAHCAIAKLGEENAGGVRGSVQFVQRSHNDPTSITGEIRGLTVGSHKILLASNDLSTSGAQIDLTDATLLCETKTGPAGTAKIDIIDREIYLDGSQTPIGGKLIVTTGTSQGESFQEKISEFSNSDDSKKFAKENVEVATITQSEENDHNPAVPQLNE